MPRLNITATVQSDKGLGRILGYNCACGGGGWDEPGPGYT